MDNGYSQTIPIDISKRGEGVLDIEIPLNKIEIPMGVKVLNVRPSMIRAEVIGKKQEEQKNEQKNK
jgi:hypothetical protein